MSRSSFSIEAACVRVRRVRRKSPRRSCRFDSDKDTCRGRGTIMRRDGDEARDHGASVAPPEPVSTGEGLRLSALVALPVSLIGLCVGLAAPLLPAIPWGVALAILARPLHRRIGRHVAPPGSAAAISTSVVV